MAGPPARLADLRRIARQSTVLAHLESRRLQRAQALRQACASACGDARLRETCAQDDSTAHGIHRQHTMRVAYDAVAGQRIGVDRLQAVRGHEDELRHAGETLAAEVASAMAARHAAETALAQAETALLQALRRSQKRERLADHLLKQHRRALDDADDAVRAEEADERAANRRG